MTFKEYFVKWHGCEARYDLWGEFDSAGYICPNVICADGTIFEFGVNPIHYDYGPIDSESLAEENSDIEFTYEDGSVSLLPIDEFEKLIEKHGGCIEDQKLLSLFSIWCYTNCDDRSPDVRDLFYKIMNKVETEIKEGRFEYE